MMSEATVVDARLDKLEQDNRRLKLALGALLLALAAVPLIGAVMPEQIPQVIRAREFRVIDENGTWRARMNANSIRYADENGKPRAYLTQLGLSYYGENGGHASLGHHITWSGPALTTRTLVGNGVHVYDENKNLVWSTLCAPNC